MPRIDLDHAVTSVLGCAGQQRRDKGMPVPEGQLGGLHSDLQDLRGQLDHQAQLQEELQADVRAANAARAQAEQTCAESVRQAEAEAADLRLQVQYILCLH